jgi:TatD DNase family protein
MMHDTHCHLDLYDNPLVVATNTERLSIFTIAVTNLPSAYFEAKPHMQAFRHLNLALGLHPLLAQHHTKQQLSLFRDAFRQTEFIGEVGLDLSSDGKETKETQISSFKLVLSLLQRQLKVVTIHSRRAENLVLDLLSEYQVTPVIFHWYSGPLSTLRKIALEGHYFSINPAMTKSKNGQDIISHIPIGRLLTETDGPFVKLQEQPAYPSNVAIVHEYLAKSRQITVDSIVSQLSQNLSDYLDKVRSGASRKI